MAVGRAPIFLGLLHVDDKLGHAWVGLPQFVEAEDEFYPRGPVQAGAVLLEVVEDCLYRDVGVNVLGTLISWIHVDLKLARMRF